MRYHQAVHEVPSLFEGCERSVGEAPSDIDFDGYFPPNVLRSEPSAFKDGMCTYIMWPAS